MAEYTFEQIVNLMETGARLHGSEHSVTWLIESFDAPTIMTMLTNARDRLEATTPADTQPEGESDD